MRRKEWEWVKNNVRSRINSRVASGRLILNPHYSSYVWLDIAFLCASLSSKLAAPEDLIFSLSKFMQILI